MEPPIPALLPDLGSRARRVLAGGATHSSRSYRPAIYVAAARGARKWLVDGRELVDYTMGHGALLLGHAHPAVVAAVSTQLDRGTHFGAASELEIDWAERIVALVPWAERVRFTSSGTEATMLAARLARVFTGRELIVKLDDHFHGWYDATTIDLDDAGRPAPPPGIPPQVAGLTRVVRAGDKAALESALQDRRAAALFLEASGAHFGWTPLDPAFVHLARRLCDATGTLLVFDEVVTGFRVDPGGIQSVIRVRPDLSVFGKIMAGGLPGGAVGGRADVMDLLSVAPADGEAASARFIYHPGTFNANPLTASAGIATLDLVADGTAQRQATAYAERLEQGFREELVRAGVPGRVWRLSSILHCALDDHTAHRALSGALREAGIDLLRTSGFCSTAHGDAELEWSIDAFHRGLRSLLRLLASDRGTRG